MSKSAKSISAKPFVKEKESEKVGRKIRSTIDRKMERERQLDPQYDLRRQIMQARYDSVSSWSLYK